MKTVTVRKKIFKIFFQLLEANIVTEYINIIKLVFLFSYFFLLSKFPKRPESVG